MKKFYKENRVFVILMGVVLVCVAIMLFMLAKYVFKSNTNNVYGNRLDGIKDVEISNDKKDEIEASITEMEKVEKVTINIHGKIIYFNVNFTKDIDLDAAKNVAIKCIDFFDESYKNFYDMQFLFTKTEQDESETTFPMIGYMKAGATTITWSNNAR